ncbi:SCO2522 family protein [Phytohabitans sp. ZYX-F-186]|uniref:SCO2522 family protein n=1 Tax=Phytohabitans maris TaxID=3071409 RepID=A0ABU0ZB34_9ACTN|nr:SCO2522 family protein [Phytohabitans sp. ZYX-F-186]MDQ7904275.1 SCO2522 family protein [Phytohabitans sp. ZYX-F-186]
MAADATFREAGAERRTKRLPLSHLSIELGHLYMEDFVEGPARLRALFERVAPWAEAARRQAKVEAAGKKPRISTCFLVDDYFTRFKSPAEVIPTVLDAARESDLEIDYVARESGCAVADGIPLARLVEGRLVPDPPPGTNGSRPPVTETGWLSNGLRSPVGGSSEAMAGIKKWRPPVQNAANRHSIFMDVEIWDESRQGRVWSCAFLAAVWQLVRLGLLRNEGEPVMVPRTWDGEWPEDWDQLPAIVRLNPSAAPFSAYRTYSVLPVSFLPVEGAVRTIISQFWPDSDAMNQLASAAEQESVDLPRQLVDRLRYALI